AYFRGGQFKDTVLQILDKPLPRGRWVTLDPADGEMSQGTYEQGIVYLGPSGGLDFPTIRGRNMTIRARVKKPDWDGHLTLSLRFDPQAHSGYVACFRRGLIGDGYGFAIQKFYRDGKDLKWFDLKGSGGILVPDFDPNDFFEMSFSAID